MHNYYCYYCYFCVEKDAEFGIRKCEIQDLDEVYSSERLFCSIPISVTQSYSLFGLNNFN